MSDTELEIYRHGRNPAEARTLLFLHGLTDAGTGWPEAVEHWQDSYAIVAVDQRGHGRSPRFTADQLRGEPGDLMVDDVLNLLGQLDRPVLIGHSLGGAVALAAAVRRPDLVRAVVLEDPAPLGPEEEHPSARASEFVADLQDSLAARDDEELLAVRRRQHPDWPSSELLVTGQAEQRTDLDFLASGRWKPTTRWDELFDSVRVPTLVVSGDRMDEVVVDEAGEKMLAESPNPQVSLHRIAGAGHCVRRDQPAAYYRLVDDWLAGLP